MGIQKFHMGALLMASKMADANLKVGTVAMQFLMRFCL